MKKNHWVRNIALVLLICTAVTMFAGCEIPKMDFFGGDQSLMPNGENAISNQQTEAATDESMPTQIEATEEAKESITLDGTVKCYAQPDLSSQVVATFNNGLEVTYDEVLFIGNLQWVECQHGWVVIAGEETPVISDPKDGFIRAKLLNIRTAPGESSPLATQLPKGTFVHVYESKTVEDGTWARIDQGWAYMRHIYFPGENGNNTGYAVARDNGAKVSTRVLESGETVKNLKAGTRVAFQEKLEMQNGDVWIYAEGGWLKGKDIYIEGDEGKRPAQGIVVDETPLNVRRGPGTNYEIVRSLPYGTEVHVIERINRGKFDWGFVGDGWIYMEHVSLEQDN